ncbi:hypothetical protein, partial [Roseobacter sp. HKCCD8914]|uniref:hypothetical protein n=1 Tax=Roseobacter sp. HKCCD8914 TaxID=2690704 RepID=UPI001C0F39CF
PPELLALVPSSPIPPIEKIESATYLPIKLEFFNEIRPWCGKTQCCIAASRLIHLIYRDRED